MAKSGLELMLGMAGMKPAMDAARQLVESGAVDKIMSFANDLGAIHERLQRIEHLLQRAAVADAALAADGSDSRLGGNGAASGAIDAGCAGTLRRIGGGA